MTRSARRAVGAAPLRRDTGPATPRSTRTGTARTLRSATRVRSCTSPASWPQAAAMSSPRVLRTVVTIPPCCSTAAKAATRSGADRCRPEAGNGLKGIRLILQASPEAALPSPRTSASSARACSGESLTPSSMQYSRVMKSRGARAR